MPKNEDMKCLDCDVVDDREMFDLGTDKYGGTHYQCPACGSENVQYVSEIEEE